MNVLDGHLHHSQGVPFHPGPGRDRPGSNDDGGCYRFRGLLVQSGRVAVNHACGDEAEGQGDRNDYLWVFHFISPL